LSGNSRQKNGVDSEFLAQFKKFTDTQRKEAKVVAQGNTNGQDA